MPAIHDIAVVHPDCAHRGGAENVIFWQCAELHRRGIRVTVYSGSFPAEIPPSFTAVRVSIGLKIMNWPASKRLLGERLPAHDAVILHNFPAAIHYGFAADYAAKHGRTLPKAVWYCHEPKRLYYGDDAVHYREIDAHRQRSLRFDEKNTVRLDKKAVLSLAAVAANSGKTARHARAVYGRTIDVMYPGIPDEMLVQRSAERTRRFLFVSRLFSLKNVFTPLIAFRDYLSRRPKAKEILTFVGDGPERESIISLAHTLGIAAQVEIKGFVADAELDALTASSLAVIAVPRTEPFGLLTLEAWARRTPLILAHDAGSAEIVTNGVNALVVDGGNPLSIASAMERIASSPSYARSLGENGFRTLTQGYMIRHHVEKLLAVLR